jgi:hypothetical protein
MLPHLSVYCIQFLGGNKECLNLKRYSVIRIQNSGGERGRVKAESEKIVLVLVVVLGQVRSAFTRSRHQV